MTMIYRSNSLNQYERIKEASIQIKDRLELKTVIQDLTGRNFIRGTINCPFHNEKTGSFKLNGKHRYKCFGCGESGDIITFTMKHEGLSFVDAVKYLDSKYSIGLINQQISFRQQHQARQREVEKNKKELLRMERKALEDWWTYKHREYYNAIFSLEPFSMAWCWCKNKTLYYEYLLDQEGDA